MLRAPQGRERVLLLLYRSSHPRAAGAAQPGALAKPTWNLLGGARLGPAAQGWQETCFPLGSERAFRPEGSGLEEYSCLLAVKVVGPCVDWGAPKDREGQSITSEGGRGSQSPPCKAQGLSSKSSIVPSVPGLQHRPFSLRAIA